ncbi:WHG domain-containing protein [Halobacillus salinus]|uniref:WHG domain-containing protein n=1 Tax=Halobacillus salinus TaxID=192814 RepID=UPI0009A5B424|nr:WHG domain-containing protein [Halobacillus salinus]
MSPRAGLNQSIILNKAMEITEREGINGVTMGRLARELNVKPPSLYNHYANLTEVKKQVSIRSIHQFQQQVEVSTAEERTIFSLAKGYLAFAQTHPYLYEASLSAPNPADSEVMSAGEGIVRLSKEAIAPFALTDEESIHAVRGLRSLLHGLLDLEQKSGFNLGVELASTEKFVLTAYVEGLKKKSSRDL